MAKGLPKKVIKQMLEAIGLTLDPFQIDALYMMEKCNRGSFSSPRQQGKTYMDSGFLMLGALQGQSGLFFAHNSDAVRNAMNYFVKLCRPLLKEGIVSKISTNHGFTQVEFSSGAVVYFRVRTPGASVGLVLDRIVFDEAQKMGSEIMEEVPPTLTHSKVRKIFMTGTPPTTEDIKRYGTNTPFIKAREAGENFIEYSYSKEYSPDIPITAAAAKVANPAWRRIPDFNGLIRDEMNDMSHEAFCRQRLGIWILPETQEIHEPYLSYEQVQDFLTKAGSTGTRFTASLGILPDSTKAWLTVCDGGISEVIEEFDVAMGGLDDVVNFIVSRAKEFEAINIPNNARGKAVESRLREKRVNLAKLMTVPDTSSQIQRFLKQTSEGSLKVYNSPDVEMALTSFWIGIHPMSGGAVIHAGIPEEAALILSLVNATKDGKLVERATNLKVLRW